MTDQDFGAADFAGLPRKDPKLASESPKNPDSETKSDHAFGHDATVHASKISYNESVFEADLDAHSANTDVESMDGDEDPTLASPGEERILEPARYFDNLNALECNVAANSVLYLYSSNTTTTPISSRSQCSEKGCILRICGKVPSANFADTSNPYLPRHSSNHENCSGIFDLLECRNLLARVMVNAAMMQEARYSNGTFNLLVLDSARSSVARLIPFHVSALNDLFEAFEYICQGYETSHVQSNITRSPRTRIKWPYRALTLKCQNFLIQLCLPQPGDNNPVTVWRRVTHTLDFALLSYAGAHLEAFDEKFLGEERNSFTMHGESRSIRSQTMLDKLYGNSSIVLRRRRLQCLDEFLGRQAVWVFHLDKRRARARDDSRLLLSTRVESLAEIWGPMWKSSPSPNAGKFHEYNIGNGVIIPWNCRKSDAEPLTVQLNDNERFCHWIPSKRYDAEDVEAHQLGIADPFFEGTETLLIGALENSDSCSQSACAMTRLAANLRVNPVCHMSTDDLSRIKSAMWRKMALRQPRTVSAKRYKDSHAVQIQGSAMGFFSVADTITYKRRSGQSMKDALIERWRYGKWNPAELESFSGVEISLCTNNARKQRLMDILRTKTMRKYLSSISFEWADEACKHKYFESLVDPKTFYRSWNICSLYRKYWGKAISACLDALQETGVNEDNLGLSALWVESFDEESKTACDISVNPDDDSDLANGLDQLVFERTEEWIVTLTRSEHNWTGFLHDSTVSLTMAVMDSACLTLDSPVEQVRDCQLGLNNKKHNTVKRLAAEYPVLQTALQINQDLLRNEGLKYENISWSIQDLKKGARFSLGEQGFLTVFMQPKVLAKPVLFMEWHPVKSKKWQELKDVSIHEDLLGKDPEKHHQEYITGKWDVEPLPIIILSKTKKAAWLDSKARNLTHDACAAQAASHVSRLTP